jgi:hypothetical protein
VLSESFFLFPFFELEVLMIWQHAKIAGCLIGALAALLMANRTSLAQLNGVTDPDFEIDADSNGFPDLWFRGGTVGYVLDDSDGIGTHSVSAQSGGDWRSRAIPVLPGQVLTYALDYKVSQGATGTIRTDLRFFTGGSFGGGTSGAFQGEFAPTTDVATVPQGVWNTLGPFTVTVPAGSSPPLVVPAWGDVRLSAGIFGPALVGTVQFDNVRVIIPEPATVTMTMLTCLALLFAPRQRKLN